MPKSDTRAVAFNAAGIADAFHGVLTVSEGGERRLETLSEMHSGWSGLMLCIAQAAAEMERYRLIHGEGAKWGGELPYVYDVWDAIAQELWERLDTESPERIAREAIARTNSVEAR